MLYEEILRLCKESGTTVAALERELKMANATIRRWKNSSPTVANAAKVAEFFGVSLDSLIQKSSGAQEEGEIE